MSKLSTTDLEGNRLSGSSDIEKYSIIKSTSAPIFQIKKINGFSEILNEDDFYL